MSFEPRNVLITGGAGFIGANFVRHWLGSTGSGAVVVFDALTYAGNVENLNGLERNPRFAMVRADICDEDAVRAVLHEYAIDTVVHFAAESHVDRSILGPDEFVRTNVVGTHVLLKAAKSFWMNSVKPRAHRFHHVSTDEVYGSLQAEEPAFSELTRYSPNSPYSASKAASDHLVRAYHETYGLSTTVTNCSNNYGPYQFPEKLVPLVIINALMGKSLPVYGDGHQIRDWLHVDDHCNAISLALSRGDPGQVYNIGGNSETSNIKIVRTICGLVDEHLTASPASRDLFADAPATLGKRTEELIAFVRDRAGHDRRYAIDFRKAQKDLGYAPSRTLNQGLRETFEWYLANIRWWRPLLSSDYSEWIEKNYHRN